MNGDIRFFEDENLPFISSRYSINSSACYKEHSHESFSVGAIEKGVTRYLYDKKEFILKPNELALINPDVMHSCNPFKDEARSYHMLYIDVEWCKSNIFCDSLKLFSTPHLQDKKLFDKFIELSYFLCSSEFYMDKHIKSIDFIEELFGCKILYEKLENDRKISSIKEYLRSNISQNPTLEEISKEFGYSATYFIKLFKKHTGQSPHEYMLFHRIELAKKELLKQKSISETALECGFFDQSHFHKYFKQIVAVTPSQFRLNRTHPSPQP